MADPKNSISEIADSVQQIYTIKEHLVDKDLTDLESRLNKRIDEVKKDLNQRMDRSETRLKWFIGIAVTIGSVITSGIVALIVAFLSK